MSKSEPKKSSSPFRGMMPVLPTPLDDAGRLDEPSLRRLVQYCLKCGAVAIGHLGGASEAFKIPYPERARIIEVVVDETRGRAPVFIGVGGASDRIATGHARQAQDLGANILMLPPPYPIAGNATELYSYYEAVSRSVKIPIIIQDAGGAPALTTDLMCRLCRELDNIRYVKSEASDFLAKTAELLEKSGGSVSVIGGYGGKHLIHMLRLGITSFMTGTEALDLHGAVVAAFLAGDVERAARLYYEKLLPYLMLYLDHPRHLKEMLHRRGVLDSPRQILPGAAMPLSPAEKREFEWVLDRIGLTARWPEINRF